MRGKYLGKKTANELSGAAVRLKRDIQNGNGKMPAGTEGIIENTHGFVKDGKLRFLAKKCECCHFQWGVSGLSYSDLELVPESAPGEIIPESAG